MSLRSGAKSKPHPLMVALLVSSNAVAVPKMHPTMTTLTDSVCYPRMKANADDTKSSMAANKRNQELGHGPFQATIPAGMRTESTTCDVTKVRTMFLKEGNQELQGHTKRPRKPK
jgi:hypothetical protein